MTQSFKRRNYFIDKVVQGRFIVGFSAASLAGGVVAVFCFRYFAQKKLDATLYAMRLPDVPMRNLLMGEMVISTILTALFVVLLFVFTARKVFSRIEGPLKKMAGSLARIAAGDLRSEVKLRENDEFQEFAEEVNSMVQAMNSRLSALGFQAEKISNLCNRAGEEENVPERVRHHLRAMKKEMQVFKL
ncbi:MAG: HAMP domain-containing protein [Proteobacteria bacterium]|nr:HAMP domain-containing protein [Pseudomonadota bacterium]MBU0968306.1 HAMP domain-containing protein [Pseudomonadota bacterium]